MTSAKVTIGQKFGQNITLEYSTGSHGQYGGAVQWQDSEYPIAWVHTQSVMVDGRYTRSWHIEWPGFKGEFETEGAMTAQFVPWFETLTITQFLSQYNPWWHEMKWQETLIAEA